MKKQHQMCLLYFDKSAIQVISNLIKSDNIKVVCYVPSFETEYAQRVKLRNKFRRPRRLYRISVTLS